jgi:hypothetical protein
VFERLSAEGFFFHRKCFKCEHCELTLRLGNYGYVPPEDGQPGRFYCKAHYRKVFYETPGKSPRDKERKGRIVILCIVIDCENMQFRTDRAIQYK